MSRRFSTPGLLLRAYSAHQHTRARLRKLLDDAEDEQHALDRDMADLLRHFPNGVFHQDEVYRLVGRNAQGADILVTPAPVASYDLDTWADVEEWGREDVPDDLSDAPPIGPGPDAPSFTVPAGDEDADAVAEAKAVYDQCDTFGSAAWPYDGADNHGMTEPFDPVPPNADSYPADESLSLAGIEVRDDDGDDL